jgi:hypothetical protein
MEAEFEKKFLRAQRFKTVKDLEKEYSKELINLYREKVDQKKREDEFQNVMNIYKTKLEEIEFLKNKKIEIFENIKKNQIEKEKSNLMLQEYLKEVDRKKLEFEKFMKEKGREALNFVKRNEEIKKKLEEELHKYEIKKRVKEDGKTTAKCLVESYKEKKEKEIKEELERDNFPHKNVMYKINQTFHNLGNKIDYSTTRFHNIVVVKHEDQLKEIDVDNFLSAQEKALKEVDKLKIRKKSKEIAKKQFESETKLSSKEILRKERAKENLNRLQDELNRINQARKKSKSKNKVITKDNMRLDAKTREKSSQKMMNKLLENKMKNRRGIYNSNQKAEDNPIIINQQETLEHADDISEFYKDQDDQCEIVDDYLNEAILEHNKEIEEKERSSNTSNYMASKTVNKYLDLTSLEKTESSQKQLYYEEPLLRDEKISSTEAIKRLNPVDLQSYGICKNDFTNFSTKLSHKNNVVNNINSQRKNIEEFNINDLLMRNKVDSSSNYLNNNFSDVDQKTKQKASSLVMEFLNDIKNTPIEEAKTKVIYLFLINLTRLNAKKINKYLIYMLSRSLILMKNNQIQMK